MKRKSKVWNKFLVILLAVFSLSVLSPEMSAYLGNVQTVQAAKLSSKTLTLIKGQKKVLKLSGATQKVKWKSSKKAVATVSSRGKITAKKAGTAKITAQAGTKKYTCTVRVEEPKLNRTAVTLYAGKTYQLKVKGTRQKVTWTNSNRKVAAVNSKGLITGRTAGTTKITANVGGKKYSCKVTIKTLSPAQIQASAYKKLKNYIVNNGVTNHDGNKVVRIKMDQDGLAYTWGIVYDQSANMMEFILSTTGDKSRSSTDMKVLVRTDSANVTFLFIMTGDESGFKAQVQLDGKQYDGINPVAFTITKTSGIEVPYKDMNDLANAHMKAGFAGWQSILTRGARTSFNELGFTAYKGE